jgi:hypothetical protein
MAVVEMNTERPALANRGGPGLRAVAATATRWSSYILTTAILLELLAYCWLTARHPVLDYVPTNGTFQLYNPQRRLLDGQVIGRDFQVYLGIGPNLLIQAGMRLTGSTLADALVVGHFLAAAVFVGSLLVLGRACGLSWFWTALCAGALLALGTLPPPIRWLAPGVKEWTPLIDLLARPGNSLLSLRSAVPFIAAGLLLADSRARGGSPGSTRRRVLEVGAVAGLALLWSNDYGLPTCVSLCGIWGLLDPLNGGFRRRLAVLVAVSLTALAAAGAALTIFTAGHPLEWFRYHYLGMAEDQFWYFLGVKLCQIQQVPFDRWIGAALACGAILSARLSLRAFGKKGDCPPNSRGQSPFFPNAVSKSGLREVLLLFLLSSSLLAGYLTSFGEPNAMYFYSLRRVLVFVLPYTAWVVLSAGLSTIAHRIGVPGALLLGRHAVAVAALAGGGWLLLRFAGYTRKAACAPPPETAGIAVPELGGTLSRKYDTVVAIGREWRERPGGPPRVFATYASGLEAIAGVFQPTGHDYIIHALGRREGRRYLETFLAQPPDFAVTLRDRYPQSCSYWGTWEGWIRRVNWDWYVLLLERYRPAERTLYATIWEKRAAPRPPSTVPVQCQWTQLGQGLVELAVSLPAGDPSLTGTQVVEVTLHAEAEWTEQRWRCGGLRHYLSARTDRAFAVNGMLNYFGLPLGRGPTRFPVDVEPGGTARTLLVLEPQACSRLSLRSCTARHVAAKAELDEFRPARLRASSICDAHFQNGISRASPAGTGFVVSDPEYLVQLGPGDHLRFAHSGWRTVTAIAGSQVTVDGPPLDPSGDGFPHAIEVAPLHREDR